MDRALVEKYENADYIVEDDPPLVLRIGVQNDGIRILFASFNVESAAFITAWNPGSELLPWEDNQDRQMDLLAEIEKLRLNYFVGRGEDPGGDWAEDSYLVLGLQRDDATSLAETFGQNAYVWIPLSGVPELVSTSSGPE